MAQPQPALFASLFRTVPEYLSFTLPLIKTKPSVISMREVTNSFLLNRCASFRHKNCKTSPRLLGCCLLEFFNSIAQFVVKAAETVVSLNFFMYNQVICR